MIFHNWKHFVSKYTEGRKYKTDPAGWKRKEVLDAEDINTYLCLPVCPLGVDQLIDWNRYWYPTNTD